MSEAISIFGTAITIFSFLANQFPDQQTYNNKFRLRIASDYNNIDGHTLTNAGGTKPDTRIWDPVGRSLGTLVNDGNKCEDGDTVCDYKIKNVRRAPDYALFTANDDAICINALQTTYPDGSKYASVIGQWAEECMTNHDVMQATWYVTRDKYQTKNHGSINVKCAWIDKNGDQPCTGIQVYWPRYDNHQYPAKTDNSGQYCNDHTNLFFHKDKDPNYVIYKTGSKRDETSASGRSLASPDAFDVDNMPQDRRRALDAKSTKTGSSAQWSHMLVKSHLPDQDASYLCEAKGAAGPSFVSFEERMFCFMPTKQLFPFCEDVASGACWDDNLNLVVPKLVDALVPGINFTSIAKWTDFRVIDE